MAKYPQPPPPEHPWDRIEPSPKAWRAFHLYREMGAARSIAKVREALGKPPGYTRLLEEWSQRYDWARRAQAWDTHVADEAHERTVQEHAAALREMQERHRRQAEELQEALMAPVKEFVARLRRGDPQLTQDIGSLPAGSLLRIVVGTARVVPVAVQLERQARGLPTDGPLEIKQGEEDTEFRIVIDKPPETKPPPVPQEEA